MQIRHTLLTLALLLTLPGLASAHSLQGKPQPVSRIVGLQVQPSSLTFTNSRDLRSIVVTGRTAAGYGIDLSPVAHAYPVSPLVRMDEKGYFHPLRVGSCMLVVTAEGKRAEIPIKVVSVSDPPISFMRDVEPLMSKVGCNAGVCHGAAAGKNGFHLSLRGYDPSLDYASLIDDVSGRRFNRTDPSRSLMLLKPTEGVPHRGGRVIEPGSVNYWILRKWITQGVHSDVGKVSRPTSLEVIPHVPNVTMPGFVQKTLVIAHYSDGTTRDVTSEAELTSNAPVIATVSEAGYIHAVRRGEAAMLVRYEGCYATVNITVLGDRRGYKWTPAPEFNYIDRLVDAKLKKVKTLPAPVCDDAAFLRRVSLDLTGYTPTPSQIRAFLADTRPTQIKRAAIVDQLLASPAYADRWADKWADLLDCNSKYMGPDDVHRFHAWLHQAMASNMPYNQFVDQLLTASGDCAKVPAANYMRVISDPSTATEDTTQLFMGVRFSCARCHDHPFEKWTQDQYYQIGAFFAQVQEDPVPKTSDVIIKDIQSGENMNPRTDKAALPIPPTGSIRLASYPDRRDAFAAWLTSAQNPFFARAITNRLWSYFMGKGIIDPVDDIRADNPPSNPALLETMTQDFIDHHFDMKHLMREIILSRAYQSAYSTNSWNADDTINFSHDIPRRLDSEQLLDAVSVATGVLPDFSGAKKDDDAQQLSDVTEDTKDSFLNLFGRPQRQTPCECERNNNMGLVQALDLINGDTVSNAIADPHGRIAKMIAKHETPSQMVDEIFLAALSRPPDAEEKKAALHYFKIDGSPQYAAQDLMWALINSPAFLFDH